MRCPTCGHDGPDGAKFCTECGAAQRRRCASCATDLPPTARFCPECGTPATPATPATSPRPAAEPAAGNGSTAPPHPRRCRGEDGAPAPGRPAEVVEAERRRMTVLFADLVGSTPMSAAIDPEDYGEVIGRYAAEVERIVRGYDGYVANYLGDGVVVYFGYPRAHEEDSCRACLAALEIADAIPKLDVEVGGARVDLAVRIGIHSGTAIIGAAPGGTGHEVMAVGETLNVASRLQSVAAPNTAVVSAETERLIRRFVRTRHLGSRRLRGIPEPVEVFELAGTREDGGGGDEGGAELSPLVGRDLELEVLRVRWDESRRGKGRVVVVTGEAGLGKSRLIRALHAEMDPPFAWLLCRATSFYSDTPLRPVVDALPALCDESAYGVPTDPIGFASFLDALGLPAAEALPLVGRLFGVPVPAGAVEALQLTPQVVRRRTLELLAELVAQLAQRRPLAFVVDDAHWLDETSLELLDLLAERAQRSPLLLLVSGRPAFQPPLVVDSELALRRLPRDHAEAMMRNIAAGILPADAADLIAQRADGNPLYLEELTRTILDARGATAASADTVPASLQELLLARLDRASAHRTLVQAASAVGRTFSYAVIRELVPMDDEAVRRELDRHVADGLLSRRGRPPDATYTFRHTLLRDAVYESVTRRARRRYHRRIAAVLEQQPATVPPEVIAHHLSEAGDAVEAATHWNLAASAALDGFALPEAMNHLRRGLDLLAEADADGADAVLAELRLRTTLGVPLMLTQGFASPAAGENYRRLLEIAEEAGEAASDALLPALWGMWTFYEVGVQLPLAEQMGRRLLDLSDQLADTGVRLAGHIAYGAARLLAGDLAEARRHFEDGLAVYDRRSHGPLAKLFGQDGGSMCSSFLTWVHAHDGDEEARGSRAAQSLALCDELEQPATRAFVETVLASSCCVAGRLEEAEAHARRVIELADRQGMPHWAAQGRCNLGWALTGQGEHDAAVAAVRHGLEGLAAVGARAANSYFRAALVEAELGRGDLASAGAALADLHAFVAETGERFYESAVWRLDGELAAARGDVGRAEESLRRAVEVARAQGADGLARRAAGVLAGLAGG
ncbi:MAG: AAA family ATPase [Acidimicrobiia bacterium]